MAALKGRHGNARTFRPFRASNTETNDTQGNALGFHIVCLWHGTHRISSAQITQWSVPGTEVKRSGLTDPLQPRDVHDQHRFFARQKFALAQALYNGTVGAGFPVGSPSCAGPWIFGRV